MTNTRPTFGSLFSGIDGLGLGLELAGWECRWQVEIDPYCRAVLDTHWPDIPKFGDVRGVKSVEKVDLIAGGFPCQPFSTAGKQRGKSDDRYLWPEMLRIIRTVRPTWVLGENVPGIITMALDDVLSDLEREGYACWPFVIPAAAVGAPHRRERLWVVAYRREPRYDIAGGQIVANARGLRWRQGSYYRRERHLSSHQHGHNTPSFADGYGLQSLAGSGGAVPSRESMANSDGTRLQRYRGLPERTGQCATRSGRSPIEGTWKPEPILDRSPDGISRWLDGIKWPALLGQDQFDWEPSRIAKNVPKRIERIRAIGNSVVPELAAVLGALMLKAWESEVI